MEISELQAQIEQLQYELDAENQRGGVKNEQKVAELEKRIEDLRQELEVEQRAEQYAQQPVDLVIARGEEEIELFGVPLGAYFATIADHVAVRSVIIPAFRQLIQEKKDVEDGYNKLAETSTAETQRFTESIEAKDTEIAELKAALYESRLQTDDNATKRDNAYNELLEAKKTIDELTDKLTAATAPKTPVRSNLDGAEVVKKEKRVIYDVEYIGKRNEKFTAKFADTDESFEDYSLYKDTKYTEVTAEEAIPFRTEYLAANRTEEVVDDHTHDTSADQLDFIAPSVSPDNFRSSEEDSTTGGLDQSDASSEVAGKTVEERLQEVELKVEKLMNAVYSAENGEAA